MVGAGEGWPTCGSTRTRAEMTSLSSTTKPEVASRSSESATNSRNPQSHARIVKWWSASLTTDRPASCAHNNEARVSFEHAEEWCGRRIEDALHALHEEELDEDYGVRAGTRGLGNDH